MFFFPWFTFPLPALVDMFVCPKRNVRENQRGNQEWTIQKHTTLGTLNIARRQTKLKKHLWELTQCTIKKKDFWLFFQAHGGAGVSNDFPLAGLFSSTRTIRLADGPDEVHRRSVARMEYAKHNQSKLWSLSKYFLFINLPYILRNYYSGRY